MLSTDSGRDPIPYLIAERIGYRSGSIDTAVVVA
jgi:hypothetical protein